MTPVSRILLALTLLAATGCGQSAAPEREEMIDFSIPVSRPIREILVTGPSAPALEAVEDLAGEAVYLRYSSSCRESLEQLFRKYGETYEIDQVNQILMALAAYNICPARMIKLRNKPAAKRA